MNSTIIFETLKQLSGFITIPIIIYFIKLVIDHWNLTDLERFFLSKYKKFQLSLIKMCSWGLFFIGCLVLGIVFDIEGFLEIGIHEDQIFPVFIAIFVLMFFLSGIFNGIMHLIDKALGLKHYFIIVDDNGRELYKAIKITTHNRLLVEQNNIYTTIENYLDLNYIKKHPYSETPHRLYSNEKLITVTLRTLFITNILLLILTCFVTGLFLTLVGALISLLMLILILLYYYSIEYKELLK